MENDIKVCNDPMYDFAKTLNNVSILGTTYNLVVTDDVNHYPVLENNLGYVDFSIKTIFIKYPKPDIKNMKDLPMIIRKVIRHEIIHAFLHESGLDACSNLYEDGWATNEEMVDFFAIQLPKITQACIDAGIAKLKSKENTNELF